jgi:hypothetical protein
MRAIFFAPGNPVLHDATCVAPLGLTRREQSTAVKQLAGLSPWLWRCGIAISVSGGIWGVSLEAFLSDTPSRTPS